MTDVTSAFLDPYQAGKILEGVIPAWQQVRPNWLQTAFGFTDTRETLTVNFDIEFRIRNIEGAFCTANADPTPIQLPEYGTQELSFAYSKENLQSSDYQQLMMRQMGQQFSQAADPTAAEVIRVRKKLGLAEQRFETLFERVSRDILVYGRYVAEGENHPSVYYNFNRLVATTEAQVVKGIVEGDGGLTPSANLTSSPLTFTSNAGSTTVLPVISWTGGGTPRAWNKANIDAGTATPVKDIIQMYQTAKFRNGAPERCWMAQDAYGWLEYDINKNYADSANLLIAALIRQQRVITPKASNPQGVTYMRSLAVTEGGGEAIDIYTYTGFYNNRSTGIATSFEVPGMVVMIPPASQGMKIYGRIQNAKANYAAMPRWINYWMEPKYGTMSWEIHTSFLMAHWNINSVVSWKVC